MVRAVQLLLPIEGLRQYFEPKKKREILFFDDSTQKNMVSFCQFKKNKETEESRLKYKNFLDFYKIFSE